MMTPNSGRDVSEYTHLSCSILDKLKEEDLSNFKTTSTVRLYVGMSHESIPYSYAARDVSPKKKKVGNRGRLV